jgi:hypothetical protein
VQAREQAAALRRMLGQQQAASNDDDEAGVVAPLSLEQLLMVSTVEVEACEVVQTDGDGQRGSSAAGGFPTARVQLKGELTLTCTLTRLPATRERRSASALPPHHQRGSSSGNAFSSPRVAYAPAPLPLPPFNDSSASLY